MLLHNGSVLHFNTVCIARQGKISQRLREKEDSDRLRTVNVLCDFNITGRKKKQIIRNMDCIF